MMIDSSGLSAPLSAVLLPVWAVQELHRQSTRIYCVENEYDDDCI